MILGGNKPLPKIIFLVLKDLKFLMPIKLNLIFSNSIVGLYSFRFVFVVHTKKLFLLILDNSL